MSKNLENIWKVSIRHGAKQLLTSKRAIEETIMIVNPSFPIHNAWEEKAIRYRPVATDPLPTINARDCMISPFPMSEYPRNWPMDHLEIQPTNK
eukprot:scaffold4562_cov178-Amphora_coffeaeformis.AAC.12